MNSATPPLDDLTADGLTWEACSIPPTSSCSAHFVGTRERRMRVEAATGDCYINYVGFKKRATVRQTQTVRAGKKRKLCVTRSLPTTQNSPSFPYSFHVEMSSLPSSDELRRMAAPKGTINTLEAATAIVSQFLVQPDADDALVLKLWLPSADRRKLYKWLEEHHGRSTAWQTDQIRNYRQMTLLHPKQPDFEQARAKLEQRVHVSDQDVFYFNKFYKARLPVCQAETRDYYLNRLEPYCQTATKFAAFQRDVRRAGNLGKFRTHMQTVEEDITKHIRLHVDTVAFQNNAFVEYRALLERNRSGGKKDKHASSSSSLTRCDRLYKEPYAGKLFISIDICKSNFTMLRHFYPAVFEREHPVTKQISSSWGDFVSTFDPLNLETLRESKHLREVIFGNTGVTSKTCWLSEAFILQLALGHKFQTADVVLLSGDEVVVPYTAELYRALHAEHHGTFYKVQAFRLHRLLERDFYVKEYFDACGTGTIADPTDTDICMREIKCVPAKNVMEAICAYEGRPITDLDLRFTDESGRVAQFLAPLVQH